MYNKWVGIGRVGRDGEQRSTKKGTAVANFSMVTTYGYGDDEQAEWHSIITWKKLAEFVGDRIKKGMLVFVEGRKQARKWEDKDGNKRETVEIIANELKVLDWNDKEKAKKETPAAKEHDDDIPF